MAAPSPGHPVTVTIGTFWRIHLRPPPPTPPEQAAAAVVLWTILAVARLYFGAAYFLDCPQQPTIPVYLMGMVFIPLLLGSLVALPCHPTQLQERLRVFRVCVRSLLALSVVVWILLGDVWVFSVYQPNYDPTAADGLYCNKTLYTFAFWNAVCETFGLGVFLAKFFKGLLCFMVMSPAPRAADFYNSV